MTLPLSGDDALIATMDMPAPDEVVETLTRIDGWATWDVAVTVPKGRRGLVLERLPTGNRVRVRFGRLNGTTEDLWVNAEWLTSVTGHESAAWHARYDVAHRTTEVSDMKG